MWHLSGQEALNLKICDKNVLQKCAKNVCESATKMFAKVHQKSMQKWTKMFAKVRPKVFAKVWQKKKLFCKSTPKVCQKYFCLHSHVISFLFTITEATLHTELFTTQWYIKSKKSQKWPFQSIQNQNSSN